MTHDPKVTHPYEIVKGSVFETPMFFVTARVNADQSRDLLLHNKEPKQKEAGTNRKASVVVVKKYATTMLAGLWHLNPQPIVFVIAPDGGYCIMGDGQQRLKAVILASQTEPNIEVEFTFAFDAPPESMLVIDMGKRRIPADWLAMYGEANAKQLSEAVRMLYAVLEVPFASIASWRKVDLAPETQIEFLNKHPYLREALTNSRDAKNRINNYVGAVMWYLMWLEYGPFATAQFFDGMATGAIPSVDDPRLKTREYLGMRKQEKPPYKWNGFELLGLLIATSNAWLINQPNFVAKKAHTGAVGKSFPTLLTKDELPTTVIVTGNDPKMS